MNSNEINGQQLQALVAEVLSAIQTRILLRRDSAANWALANPVLAAGELGLDETVDKIKIGDGETEWADLAFASYKPSEVDALIANFQTNADVQTALELDAASGVLRTVENVTTALEGSNPRPIEHWGGYLWGVVNSTGAIHRSEDMGATWSAKIADFETGTQGMLPTDDGEVVFHTTANVYKTSGWSTNPATCTYSVKATVTNTTHCAFLRWGFDGSSDGSKFILVEYGVTPEFWDLSRKGFVSVDGGDTFVQRWDSFVQHGEAENELTHIHGACYDEWRDRFWISEGHSNVAGLYFSDDDGLTWTEHTGDAPRNASPTTLTATKYGIVLGTDSGNGGVYLLPATTTQATANAEWLWDWRNEINQDGVAGYAVRGYRDDSNGLVMIGFLPVFAGMTAPIIATDGLTATRVWKSTDMGPSDQWTHVIHKDGKIAAAYTASGVARTFRATFTKKKRAPDISVLDTGRILGGTTGNIKSLAVGPTSNTGTGPNCVAILGSTVGAAERSISIGGTVTGARAVGIGFGLTNSSPDSVLIGNASSSAGGFTTGVGASQNIGNADSSGFGYLINISASHSQVTATGSRITSGGALSCYTGYGAGGLFHSTSTGHGAYGTQYATSTGKNAQCTDVVNGGGTATGSNTLVASYAGVAHGRGANVGAGHDFSYAGGALVATSAAFQFHIGDKHFASIKIGSDPATPPANEIREYWITNGGGKLEKRAKFSDGATIVLGVQA